MSGKNLTREEATRRADELSIRAELKKMYEELERLRKTYAQAQLEKDRKAEKYAKDEFDALVKKMQDLRDNQELRKDLQKLIALLAKDDAASNKEQMEKTARLLEQLKELIAKQERVRAQTEMARKTHKELEKDQNKVTKDEARALQAALAPDLAAWIAKGRFAFPALELWHYRGGPWEQVKTCAFRGRERL